jgi:hypothetical protein
MLVTVTVCAFSTNGTPPWIVSLYEVGAAAVKAADTLRA